MKKLPRSSGSGNDSAPTSQKPKRTGKVAQQQLVAQLPVVTIKALKVAALEKDSTVRAMLLDALHKAGYPVPDGQAVDLRKGR